MPNSEVVWLFWHYFFDRVVYLEHITKVKINILLWLCWWYSNDYRKHCRTRVAVEDGRLQFFSCVAVGRFLRSTGDVQRLAEVLRSRGRSGSWWVLVHRCGRQGQVLILPDCRERLESRRWAIRRTSKNSAQLSIRYSQQLLPVRHCLTACGRYSTFILYPLVIVFNKVPTTTMLLLLVIIGPIFKLVHN